MNSIDQQFPLAWQVGNKHAFAEIGFAIINELTHAIHENMPDLAELFPFRGVWELHGHLSNNWLAFRLTDRLAGTGTPGVNEFTEGELTELVSKILPFKMRTYQQLVNMLGSQWYGFDHFTYIGPYQSPFASWPHVSQHLEEWVNSIVIPEVMRRNQNRVLRAIPPSPAFDLQKINQALWVLECEESMKQGTAFAISGNRLITCSHVLGTASKAFRPNDPSKMYSVRTVVSNADLDIAMLAVDASLKYTLELGSADNLNQMDHLAIAGFPNYRHGDSGVIIPGLVVGFRMVSGIRRILTNAPIVAGNSGGPVFDKNNRVIGIAVTGAELMEKVQETENHGIIPIDVLKYIQADG